MLVTLVPGVGMGAGAGAAAVPAQIAGGLNVVAMRRGSQLKRYQLMVAGGLMWLLM